MKTSSLGAEIEMWLNKCLIESLVGFERKQLHLSFEFTYLLKNYLANLGSVGLKLSIHRKKSN